MAIATFSIASSSDDAMVFRNYTTAAYPSTASAVGRDVTAMYVSRSNLDGTNIHVVCGLLKCDTSNTTILPPGATINGATLRLWYNTSVANTDGLTTTGEWYLWDGVSDSDFAHTPSTSAFSSWSPAGRVNDTAYDIVLSNAADNINRSGYTGIRLHASQLAADATPTGYNEWYWYSTEQTPSRQAQLLVDYTVTTTRLAPDAILAQTNLTGAVSAIQDDPDSADANWLTAP